MTNRELQLDIPPPSPRFQFTLRTLLLLFVVLGSSLAVFGAWGIMVFGLAVGLASYLNQVESLPSLMQLLLLLVCLFGLFALLMSGVSTARESARRVQCANNLKQIGQALHAYHQANGCFPPAYVADKHGKPICSWRVLILPYLECTSLYNAYDFSQPWDGPKNKGLSATSIPVYICPSDPNAYALNAAQTSYVAVVGPRAAWEGATSRHAPVDFPGGTSNTIMVVEVSNSGINWAEPRDLSLDAMGTAADKSLALMPSSNHGRRKEFFFTYDDVAAINVAMVDGSVQCHWIGGRASDELRKILEIDGCGDGVCEASFDAGRHLNWPNIAALAVWLVSVGTLLTHAVRSRKPTYPPSTPPPAGSTSGPPPACASCRRGG